MSAIFAFLTLTVSAFAQDLGPRVQKLADGVYVHTGKGFESNSGIILTQEGVVVIDTGQNPIESRDIMDTVKKLTSMPVRLVIDTEPHADHTTGHYVFSPPAIVVAAAGAGESMRGADRAAPDRIQRLAASSPEMKAALEGYRFITPHIEYHDKMTINLGGRVLELMYLKGVHSESDTAVWLPKERVLFSASAFVVNQINILRPIVNIPDILAAGKMMKALNPEHVVPGHGTPGTVKIFEDGERYYALLLDRVGKLMKEGKSLDDLRKEVKMPEYASWGSQERFPTNVDAAYRALGGK
ncbi:MAG TPA: MBL fold metallo-hydrolase [Xanthobacteraceae bacterium]|jgi:cyclase|nr:MBL fold metallo-hydrolase [Xanthobacteraceae bacterium]